MEALEAHLWAGEGTCAPVVWGRASSTVRQRSLWLRHSLKPSLVFSRMNLATNPQILLCLSPGNAFLMILQEPISGWSDRPALLLARARQRSETGPVSPAPWWGGQVLAEDPKVRADHRRDRKLEFGPCLASSFFSEQPAHQPRRPVSKKPL